MIMLKLVILIIILFFIGLLFYNKLNENGLCVYLVIGVMSAFAILEIISLPMIFWGGTFNVLMYVYIGMLLILFAFSLILNRTKIIHICQEFIVSLKKMPVLLTIVVLILIFGQCMALYFFMHENADDAFFIGTAITSIKTNSLYKYSPYTEFEDVGTHLSLRYRLAPFPIFNAILAVVLNITPTICAHTIIPLLLIPLAYMIYYLIAKELFKDDLNKTMSFMVFINIIIMFSGYSTRTNYTYFLTRIWQGKSVLGNIILPSIWLFFIINQKNKYKLINYILIAITMLAGNLTSSMGVVLPTMTLLILGCVDEFEKIKEIKEKTFLKKILRFTINMFKYIICCIPSVIYGLIYILQ